MLVTYILLSIACIVAIKYLRDYLNYRKRYNQLPGDPNVHPFLGNLNTFPGPNEEHMPWYYAQVSKYKYFHRLWMGPFFCIMFVYHPESVREIIRASVKPRNPSGLIATTYDMGTGWLGEGLVLATGARWHRTRRLLTPSFHFDILKSYMEVYNTMSNTLLDQIQKFSTIEKSFDLDVLLKKYTLDVILRCAFSMESQNLLDEEPTEYAKAIEELQELWMARALNPLHFFEFIYKRSSKGRRFYELCDVAHKVAEDLIKHRLSELDTQSDTIREGKSRDFLDTLITARDDEGNGLSWQEMRQEVDTFLFAGHDTTATGIMWTLVSLAGNPDIQEQVFTEVDQVIGDREDVVWSDLSQLQFTGQCIKEASRLHGTVPALDRVTTEDVQLNGQTIPAGTQVAVSLWCLHNNPHVWENPREFRPDRFSPENVAKMDPFQFIPFSAGSRNCIGQNFAMNEMKVTVAHIVRRFRLSLDSDRPIGHKPKLTMKSPGGAFVFASSRKEK